MLLLLFVIMNLKYILFALKIFGTETEHISEYKLSLTFEEFKSILEQHFNKRLNRFEKKINI